MVTRYSMLNQHDALYQTARDYPGGIDALARDMGKSANVLRNKLRPAITTHHATFEEVSRIMELCVDNGGQHCFRVLHAFNHRHGHVAFPYLSAVPVREEHLSHTMARVMRDLGTVAERVLNSQEDDHITSEEMEEIEQAFMMALSTLGEWRDRMRLRHAADQQKTDDHNSGQERRKVAR